MANYPARNSGDQTINYLRAPIDFSLGYTGVRQVGTLPAGAAVLRAYTVVSTAFNAGSTNTLKVGTVASDAALASSVSTSALGVNIGTMAAASASLLPTVDTPIIATMTSTGTALSAGVGVIVVEYCPVA